MKYVVIWIYITMYMLLKLIQYVLICVIINLIWDFKILPWGFYNKHTIYVFSKDFISVFGSTTFYSHPVFGRYKVYDLTTNEYLALLYTIEDERLDHAKKKYKVGCEFEALTGQSIGQLTSKYQSVTIDKSDTITFDSYSNGNININIYPNSNLNHQYSFCIYNKQTNTWAKIIN